MICVCLQPDERFPTHPNSLGRLTAHTKVFQSRLHPKRRHRVPRQPENIVQLAFNVQYSIAKLDPLQDTLKLVSQLCEQITGVPYSIHPDERRLRLRQERQQEVEQAVATDLQNPGPKPERGREQSEEHKQKVYSHLYCTPNNDRSNNPIKSPGRPKGTTRSSKESRSQRNTEIRRRYQSGTETQEDLAREYNLSPTTIFNIIHKKAGQP